MVDMKPFCSTDPSCHQLMQPWSHGAWTYATDGRVLVRVPRRDDVPDRVVASAAAAEGFFAASARSDWQDCPAVPEPEFATCKECDGGDTVTDNCKECDGDGSCECGECGASKTCSECKGEGYVVRASKPGEPAQDCAGCNNSRRYELGVAVKLNGVALNSVYLRKIAALPGIKIATGSPSDPSHFIFDGGEGRLMTMRLS